MISIVIPAYNEAPNLPELHRRLSGILSQMGEHYEILIIDDGSRDNTYEVIKNLAASDPHLKGYRFSRNFGHQAALTAGLSLASGQAVITMDADLQHPPELIPELVHLWKEEDFEIVNTYREDTADSGASKKLTSRLFYYLINWLSPIPITPGAADFRLMDSKAVAVLNAMPEKTRFLRGLIPWMGFRQIHVPFTAPPRFSGSSQYNLRKMCGFALHGILSLSSIPLRLATLIGAIVVGLGLLYGVYVTWTAIFNPESQKGWASIILVLLLLGGTQIFFMGILGEYLARVFEEVKGRPLFIIAESTHAPNDTTGEVIQ